MSGRVRQTITIRANKLRSSCNSTILLFAVTMLFLPVDFQVSSLRFFICDHTLTVPFWIRSVTKLLRSFSPSILCAHRSRLTLSGTTTLIHCEGICIADNSVKKLVYVSLFTGYRCSSEVMMAVLNLCSYPCHVLCFLCYKHASSGGIRKNLACAIGLSAIPTKAPLTFMERLTRSRPLFAPSPQKGTWELLFTTQFPSLNSW